MKNVITYLKTLWGAWGNLLSNDVRHDRRLTRGVLCFLGKLARRIYSCGCSQDILGAPQSLHSSPSGLNAKRKQKGKMEQKGKMSTSCLLLNSYLPLTCPLFASLSLVSRQSDLDTYAAGKTNNASGARVAREWLKYAAMLVMLFTIGIGNVWGAEGANHDFSQTISHSLNYGYEPDDITIAEQSYTIKEVIITYSSNKSSKFSASVSVNGNDWGTKSWTKTTNTTTYTTISYKTSPQTSTKGAVTISFTNTAGSSETGQGTLSITNVRLVEGASAAPAYTITAQSNNNSYGTVSLSGTTITATPNSGYRVMSGTDGYTVTSGTATVVNNGDNTFTVTPSSNCTVRINFESKGCTEHYGTNVTSGTATDASTYGPVHSYYNYGTRQILYTKTDLGLAAGKKGTIKSIYFEYAGAAAMAARTVKIYMANTALTALSTSAFVPYSSFSEVYSGTFSCASAGWYEITLDTPFDYNGFGNLVVLIDDNTGSYESSKYFKYHTANTTTGAQIHKENDSSNENPATTDWSTYTATNNRPNTKFCIQEADMTPATVTLKDNDATLTEASAGAGVSLPSRAGCEGYTFAGWTKSWVAPQTEWTTTAPTIIPAGTYYPTADEDLYPVYTKTEGGGSPEFSQYQQVALGGTITAGKYLISTGSYTMAGDGKTGVSLTPGTTEAAAREYTVAIVSGTTITIKGPDNKYIGGIDKADGLTFSTSTPSSDDYRWVYTENGIQNKSITGRHIKAYSTTDFRHYGTGNGTLTYFYKRIETSGSTTSYISVPACCTDWSTPTVSYSPSIALNASEGVTIGSGTTHGAVTYESSDEDVLTVDADGTIHAVGAGTAHIVATWAGDATYCEKSANSNDVTVSGIQVTGTTPVNFGQVYQNAAVADKTIYVTGLGLANPITPSLPAGSPFSFSPASLAANSSNATLTISASTATIGDYNQTLTLTSGAFSATVTVKMEVIAKPTATFTDALHNLTEDEDGVSLSSYNLTAAQGTPVVFPTLANQTKSAGTCEGEYYIFVGWTEGDNNTDPEDHLVTSYTLANGDTKNYYAVWADASGSATYTKLTTNTFKTAPTKYVIGVSSEGTIYYLHDCANTDVNNSWGYTSSDPSTDAPIEFTLSGSAAALVATSTEGSARYLKPLTAKNFQMSASSQTVTLNADGTIHNTGDNSAWNLRGNSTNLRWYDGTTGHSAYFYEVSAGGTVHYRTSCCANKVDAPVVTATAVTSTSITLTWPSDVKATGWQIEWNGAGGWVTPSGSCTHTVSGLTPNTTYTWRVRATYEDPVCGADVRSGSTTTNQVYHVTYAKGSGTGTCTAEGSTTDATGYEAGATVTLQSNGFSLSGHVFNAWTEDDPDVTISNNQFTMPDHDVVITASWTAKVDKYFDRMHDQTDALHGGVEETEGTNEGKYYIPKEGCNYSVPTAVDSNTGDACQTSHYKLQGWIAASYVASDGTITQANLDAHLFSPTTRPTHTATGATYYAVWAEVTE